ncbi:MAG: hypothetical protein WBM50_06710 [Acidimicrobiales bacterium]
MIDVDDLAASYVDSLVIPAGPGVGAIRARGQRRRRRFVAASALACAVSVSLVGAGVFAIWGGRSQSISAVGGGPDGQRTDQVATLDLDSQLAVLGDWDATELPLVPTPSLPGWTVETVWVSADRFYASGTWAMYVLRADDNELSVDISSGQVELGGPGKEAIVLDRPQGPVTAALDETGDGVTLLWNERPGANTGTAVVIRGASVERVVTAGETLVFEDLPLAGAHSPETQTLASDRVVLLQGVTGGVEWQVSRSGKQLPVLEVAGIAPTTASALSGLSTNGPSVTVASISFDGRQINMLRIPNGATAELVDPEQDRIQLPTTAVAGTTYSIAVAPIPAGKQAPVVVVSDGAGTRTTIGLPWIPADGWSSMSLSFENSDT